ncbi:MAG TPA: DNA polymerase III subunit delta' [Candidatus Sulfotelmatobacter sp.]|jgi:DNA polymerase-3 subunit delta'|nr:DNA polymerase III subunit delta' [Candidatus Sulfotelmatobacter sp.]
MSPISLDAEETGPRTATDLIGHDAAEHAFLDAWNSGRLAHAWLICGPRGIGKATLAYRIARFVLSGGGAGDGVNLFGEPEKPASLEIGPNHPVVRRIASGGHADLKVLERGWTDDKKTKLKSEIPVDDVRGVGGFMSLTPGEGGWRVVIVDAADEMNRSSANAILKVLEEPPRNALMLLLSHSPGRLLPTIRSRCRRLVLRPLADDQVTLLLRRSNPDLPEADAQALARLADGSIGKAQALAAEGGLELYREMVGLLGGLPRLDIPAVHGFADKVAKGDDAFRTVTDLLLWWIVQATTRSAGQGGGEAVPGEAALQCRLVAAAGLEPWVQLWEKTQTLFSRADAVNLDRKQVLLNAFSGLERLCRA